jgi:hypothetical protein
MQTFLSRSARIAAPRQHLAVILSFGAWFVTVPANADPAITVVRVEEDWELVVDQPDPRTTAPQVTCTFSPDGSVDALHATFELNHQTVPEFVPGGLQLQLWHNGCAVSSHKSPNASVAATNDEQIQWTQAMELRDGQLTFEIIDGTSTTWGSFGGQGHLKAMSCTELASLNSYNPAISVQHSGVGFAANRVQRMVLKEVRYHTASGAVYEDTTDVCVYQRD